MIKRRDYKLLHPRNHDEASDSSSGSEESGSEVEDVDSSDNGDWPEESTLAELEELQKPTDLSGNGRVGHSGQRAEAVKEPKKGRVVGDFEDPMVLRMGRTQGVLKCRLCPKTICLSDGTMRAHLGSKGHARAAKLFSEGRLKVVLNSDGEEEGAEEGETHAERLRRIIAVTEQGAPKQEFCKRKQSGRQRQHLRKKKKVKAEAKGGGEDVPAANPEKSRSRLSGPQREDKLVVSSVIVGGKKSTDSKDQPVIAERKLGQKRTNGHDNGTRSEYTGKQRKRSRSMQA